MIKSSRRIWRRKIFEIGSLLICSLLLAIVYSGVVFQNDDYLLSKVEIRGNKFLDTKSLFEIIKNELSGRYYGIYPKNNFLIFPKQKIGEELVSKYARLDNVSIEREGLKKIIVKITEKEPKYIWCAKERVDCYFMDAGGLLFEHSPDFSEGIFLEFQGGPFADADEKEIIGSYLIKKDKLDKLVEFRLKAEAIVRAALDTNMKADNYSFEGREDFTLSFKRKDGSKWEIFFLGRDSDSYLNVPVGDSASVLKSGQESAVATSFNTDLLRVLKNLDVTLRSEAFKKGAAGAVLKDRTLEYIDLRFGNKVFYKFGDKTYQVNGIQNVVQ